VYTVWIEKHEGKRTFGRHRYGWKDNVKKDMKEMGVEVKTRLM
jgi:hypothetical protein